MFAAVVIAVALRPAVICAGERTALEPSHDLAGTRGQTGCMTDADSPRRPPYRRILVPMDGSSQSGRALDEAIALAHSQGGALRLLAVLDETKYVNGFEPARVAIDDVLPRARRELGALLEAGRARAAANAVGAEIELLTEGAEGIAQIVCARAVAWPADLVVLGTHGRRGIERLLLGSIAEAILRRCPVPVLLVRTEGEDELPEPPA